MKYLVVLAAIVIFIVWRGRAGPFLKGRAWRLPAAMASIGLIGAAGFEGLRGGAVSAALLLAVGFALLGAARWPLPRRSSAMPGDAMSLTEARSTLGVDPSASLDDIRAAHARLIRIAHPDRGGTDGLAAQLNAARDRLLKA